MARRRHLVAGALSLAGSAGGFALAFGLHDLVSMYAGVGVVLLLNAAVRFRLAGAEDER